MVELSKGRRERREGRRSTNHSDIGPLESKAILHQNLHLTFLVTVKKDWRFRRVSSEVSWVSWALKRFGH